MASSPAAPTRDESINLRARATDRALIDRAAQAQGKSRTEFMLEAAREKAQRVLVDQTFFQLDAKAFKRFTELLDAPAEPSRKLVALLKRKPPWRK